MIATGRYPYVDYKGKAFTGWRHRMRGKLLAPIDAIHGYIGYLTEFVADWKYLRECSKLPWHYGSHAICAFCSASKWVGPSNYASVEPGAWTRRHRRTHSEFVGVFAVLPPFLGIIGFHFSMLLVDIMHTDHLGCLQHAVAAVMAFMCEHDM